MKIYWRVFISFTLAVFLVVIVVISTDSQIATNYFQNSTKAYLCLDKYCIQIPLVLDTQRTQKVLQEIADNDSISINSIIIEEFESTANIIVKDKEDYKVILTLNDDDAKTVGVTKKTLAGDLLERIKKTIIKYRITKHRRNLLQVIFIILIFLSMLILSFGIIFLIKNNLPVSISFLFKQDFLKLEYK
ncbi:hypothetical protein QUB80_06710 [Chlorogloeopsis sp. ULAP01]|uniref:hypothetical protein n=1 Tax=Chlorogloeopsis sp. ULAP01 TaxID=3056483 RepID=UPI0025AA8785|nr:hypothetical protein [Chlorogloeopsis sp. ULAP01]MDM9380392.1 hypothetical protein [Chlorogloeopsis sp. ULAP01]